MTAERRLAAHLRRVAADHPLWAHPVLARARAKRLDLAEVRLLVTQMYRFSSEFNAILANILVHCPTEAARVVLAENLYEELGQGDAARTHPAHLRRLTRALGIADDALAATRITPGTRRLIDTYMSLPQRHGWLPALAAVCHASEGIVLALYDFLRSGIAGAAPLEKDDLLFFDLHIDTDCHHAARLEGLLAAQSLTLADVEAATCAVQAALDARVAFFDDIRTIDAGTDVRTAEVALR